MTGVYWHLHNDRFYLIDAVTGKTYNRHGKPSGCLCSDGYVRFAGHYAHRAVWESVHGPIPMHLEVNHVNGDKADNRLENLELVTRSENVRHAVALGLGRRGEAKPNAKLTEARVIEARRRVAAGEPLRPIARECGVDAKTLRDAVTGRSWAHVGGTQE